MLQKDNVVQNQVCSTNFYNLKGLKNQWKCFWGQFLSFIINWQVDISIFAEDKITFTYDYTYVAPILKLSMFITFLGIHFYECFLNIDKQYCKCKSTWLLVVFKEFFSFL